jgi:hypothetical protein
MKGLTFTPPRITYIVVVVMVVVVHGKLAKFTH